MAGETSIEIVRPSREAIDDLVEQWIDLASEQYQYGSHLLAEENDASVREVLLRHLVTDRLRVARLDGETVGFVTFEVETGYYEQDLDRGIVEHLYVVPEYRDRGVGSRLLHAAESALCDRDVDAICLDVLASNRDARRFYRRHGFDTHRIQMEKPVPDAAGSESASEGDPDR